ncbi:ATP-grasp domain-containing protein [Sphaerisporangium sp. NPDC004334]
MRVAFLRSVDVRQAFPSLHEAVARLRAAGDEVAVFLVDDEPACDPGLGGVVRLPAASSAGDIAAALAAWRPDRVVSISVPDDKALRDSCVRALLHEGEGTDVVMHPLDATHALSNKWETRRVVRQLGLGVAPGFLISGDLLRRRGVTYDAYRDYLGLQLRSLSYPVVCKPVWDSMAQGIRKFERPADVERWLADDPPEVDTIVEEYLAGELFGIEVVGRDGVYWCQPLVRKCIGHGEDLVPFNHIRFGPVTDARYAPDLLRGRVQAAAAALELCGSAEFELMWWRGRFHVIEVNPRVSGMTNLSIAISGVNTYTALATGTRPRQRRPEFVAEVPLIAMDAARRDEIAAITGVRSVEGVTYHDGSTQWKMLLAADDAEAALKALTAIAHAHGVIAPRTLAEFAASLTRSNPIEAYAP